MALGSIAVLQLELGNSFHEVAPAKTPFAKLNIILPNCMDFWKKIKLENSQKMAHFLPDYPTSVAKLWFDAIIYPFLETT